jgi:hypothetical protein
MAEPLQRSWWNAVRETAMAKNHSGKTIQTKRRPVVVLLTVLLAVVLIVPATAQNSAARKIAGNWSISATGMNFSTRTFLIKQQQDTIIGSDSNGDQIWGVMTQPGEVQGRWRSANGQGGWLTLIFSADGKSLSGEYGYSSGNTVEGELVGYRLR